MAALLVLTGCVNPDGSTNNTGTGVLAGGLIGATSGAMIGGSMGRGYHHGGGHGGEGALIGAAVGALAGGLIGNSMDQAERSRLRQQAPQTYERMDQGQPLGLADVRALAQARVSDDIIIGQIRNSRTVYRLSAADIIDLRNAGVSNRVIEFMISTPSTVGAQTSATVVTQAPPPVPVETVVVAPAPGYVWVGGEWIWNGRWVWSAGHWAYPPHVGAIWIGGSWGHSHHGWYHTPGCWR